MHLLNLSILAFFHLFLVGAAQAEPERRKYFLPEGFPSQISLEDIYERNHDGTLAPKCSSQSPCVPAYVHFEKSLVTRICG
jgi:hypothetical protein